MGGMTRLALGFAVWALAGTWLTASGAEPSRTLSVDVVELVGGRETPGLEGLSVEHEGVAYLFASEANKAAFEKNPLKFCVADGGACGRMGPLSGLGDARRYAVHRGRVYFFASDGCRAGFLKEPAAYVETADETPFGSNEQVLRGREVLDRAVGHAGGAERLRGIRAIRESASRTEKQGDKDWAVTNELAMEFPGRLMQKEAWNEHWYSTSVGPDGGAMDSAGGRERIAASRAAAFLRTMSRHPLVILKSHVDGSPKAQCPGLVVLHDGEGIVGGEGVDHVKVWLNGATSRLSVAKESGRIVRVTFRGRDGTMRVGEVVRTYGAEVTSGGVTLPKVSGVTVDGKAVANAGGAFDALEVNPEIAAGLFDAPKSFR